MPSSDFLSALTAYWDGNAAITAAGIGTLHYATGPGGNGTTNIYPFVVLLKVGGKVEKRTFTGSYLDHDTYRFAIYSDDLDQASALGDTVTTALNAIGASPLSFSNGTQTVWLRSGDTLSKTKRAGTGGSPYVFTQILTYICKTSRTT